MSNLCCDIVQNRIKRFDVCIVGAGPAGLAAGMASAAVIEKSGRVCILERNPDAGRKFRLSGSGQCNLTHAGRIDDFLKHYGGKKKERFVKPALFSFDNAETIRFFEQRGVDLFEREDGKIFPKSLQSNDLLRVLLAEIESHGGILRAETTVDSLKKTENGFLIETNREELFSTPKLILATGGCSYPATGSGGDGFRLAEGLGHRIVEAKPALTPIVVKNFTFSDSAGIAFRQRVITVFRKGKRIQAGQGDVLLTHRGLSGPGILDLSRFVEPGDEIRIRLCSKEIETENWFETLSAGRKTLKNALIPLGIPERFLIQLLNLSDILPDQTATETKKADRKKLQSALLGLPFIVEKLGGWNEAMATAGGIALDEVDRQTMQSRIIPGLFFCGEVLDVDGDTGGYNIQFALSSGMLAGRSAIR